MADAGTDGTSDRDDFWDERVGPFYDRSGALPLTGLLEVEFKAKVSTDDILEVLTSDGVQLYPSFQFGPLGELLPGLRGLVEILRPLSDDLWDVAIWLATPTERVDGRSAAEVLKAGGLDSVVEIALHDVEMWST